MLGDPAVRGAKQLGPGDVDAVCQFFLDEQEDEITLLDGVMNDHSMTGVLREPFLYIGAQPGLREAGRILMLDIVIGQKARHRSDAFPRSTAPCNRPARRI